MDQLIKFLDHIVTSGGVSGVWLSGFIAIGGLGVLFFYVAKSVTLLSSHFKQPPNGVTKDELSAVKASLQDDNKYILKILTDFTAHLKSIEDSNTNVIELNHRLENEMEKVTKLTDDIKDLQDEEAKTNTVLQRDLSSLVSDSRSQYIEVTRQVQSLHVDLSALHGLIVGLNTQRSRLK
jgi:septal ring factor EnvC (AmiA/AmiB activator)